MTRYRRFTLFIISVSTGIAVLLALVNLVIDPFYIFRSPFFPVQYQINERYAKIEFLKNSKFANFDSYIFGSSRMYTTFPDMLNKYLPDSNFYSMAYAAGTPYEHLQHIQYLVRNNVTIKNIYIGIDVDISMRLTRRGADNFLLKFHPAVTGENTVKYLWSYLSIVPSKDLKRKLRMNSKKNPPWSYYVEKDGSFRFNINPANQPVFKWNLDFTPKEIYSIISEDMEANLSAIKSVKELCHQHKINLFLFTTPCSIYIMKLLNKEDYLHFLKRLSDITDYWDFGGHNTITASSSNYTDASHFNIHVSNLIAARIFGDKSIQIPDDFGFFVTRKNVDLHLKHLRQRL